MGHPGDALNVRQEVVSLYRTIAVDGNEEKDLAGIPDNHGNTLHAFEDALSVGQKAN